MLENIAFFRTKREKITGLSTLKVGGGENLLHVPTFLSGIVGQAILGNFSTDQIVIELLTNTSK